MIYDPNEIRTLAFYYKNDNLPPKVVFVEDVKKILNLVKGLPRFDVELGGCGDPECCGAYTETVVGSDYIRAEQLDALIKRLEEDL